jgi:hypothetical protein
MIVNAIAKEENIIEVITALLLGKYFAIAIKTGS